ncbi:MAG: 4Fe-4S binding protein [Bacteroidetes bacterium]|nr:4Fe-4S binding protein [Bacteroidota bacterium]
MGKVYKKLKESFLKDPLTKESTNHYKVSRALLVYSTFAILVLWPLGAIILLRGNAFGLAIALFFSGLQGPFLIGYAFAHTALKQWWRWFVLASGGLGILLFSLIDAVNLDIDGFFELLILGIAGPAIGHTMITTIVGPLIFGRVLCRWGCWRAMVLERLPIGKGSGRRKGVWVWMPLVGISISLIAAVLFALTSKGIRTESFWSVAFGIAVYYVVSIAMALYLQDQRAFCKYLCPAGFILHWTSRSALLHVSGDAEMCTDCNVCTEVCPMDIPVARRVKSGTSISKGDCILCQRCVESCPIGVLKTIFKK